MVIGFRSRRAGWRGRGMGGFPRRGARPTPRGRPSLRGWLPGRWWAWLSAFVYVVEQGGGVGERARVGGAAPVQLLAAAPAFADGFQVGGRHGYWLSYTSSSRVAGSGNGLESAHATA